MKNLKFVFLTSYLFFASFAFSQSRFVTRVISKSSKQPLEYAIGQLYNKNDSVVAQAVTNSKGKLELDNLRPGSYHLKMQYLGYETQSIPVEINKSGKNELADIELNPMDYKLGEVNVTGESNPVEFRIDKQVINVNKQLSAQGGTAADALQHSAAVQVDAEGNVSLRGSGDFLLLIDGRPSVLDASTVLTTMQSDAIDQIEIITNPSAKYTAEGNTGIINIITKSKSFESTSGMVNAMVATGEKYAVSAQMQSGLGKFNVYGGVNASSRLKINEDDINRYDDNDPNFLESYTSEREVLKESYDANVGVDAKLNESNMLKLDFQSGLWKYSRFVTSTFQSTNLGNGVNATDDFADENFFYKPGLNYVHQFDKDHKLTLDAQMSFVENKIPVIYTELDPFYQRNNTNKVDKMQSDVRLDYELPISEKMKFESGLVYHGFNGANHITYQTQTGLGSDWVVDDNLSNNYDFLTDNMAGYAIFNTDLKGYKMQFGIRAELNQRRFSGLVDDYQKEKVDWFPSLHISRNLTKTQKVGLSYSRRVNRPTEWQLYPVVWAGDRLNLVQGNPDLKDEFNHNLEFSYSYLSKKLRMNTQLYYQLISDQISSYVLYDGADFINTYENLSDGSSSGIDAMVSYNAMQWLSLSLSASGYRNDWNGKTRDDVKLKGSTYGAMSNFRTTFKYKKNTVFQFMAIYYAPQNTTQGDIDAFYYFDFILKQYLLDRKLSLMLRTHNTFDTGVMKYKVRNNQYLTKGNYVYEGPTIMFSVSYKFNNYKKKQEREGFKSDFDTGLDH
jgi:outer membrane receptor protein involved in Fe transport